MEIMRLSLFSTNSWTYFHTNIKAEKFFYEIYLNLKISLNLLRLTYQGFQAKGEILHILIPVERSESKNGASR